MTKICILQLALQKELALLGLHHFFFFQEVPHGYFGRL